MGAGKTSVGRALAERLHWLFEDLDERIEQREGRRVPEIFRESGEQEFRRMEHGALRDLLTGLGRAGRVVALGGGAFVQTENAALLKSSGVPTVFLDAPVEELWQRCCAQASTERPLLRSPEHFRALYAERRTGYTRALVTISTSNRAVAEIAAEITDRLGLKEIPIRVEQGEVE